MGMFDEVICEYPLPDGLQGVIWQTKDLDCLMNTYCITAEGVLEKQVYRREDRTPEEIEAIKREELETGLPSFKLPWKTIEDGWRTVELPRWYIIEAHKSMNGLWVSVTFHFTDGKVDGVDVKYEALSGNPADVELGFSTHDSGAE